MASLVGNTFLLIELDWGHNHTFDGTHMYLLNIHNVIHFRQIKEDNNKLVLITVKEGGREYEEYYCKETIEELTKILSKVKSPSYPNSVIENRAEILDL